MLFPAYQLSNVGEVVLLFVSNTTSLAFIMVSLVHLAAHLMLTSWCQLALSSTPLLLPENEKNPPSLWLSNPVGSLVIYCFVIEVVEKTPFKIQSHIKLNN